MSVIRDRECEILDFDKETAPLFWEWDGVLLLLVFLRGGRDG
jgi:hypothetical protein